MDTIKETAKEKDTQQVDEAGLQIAFEKLFERFLISNNQQNQNEKQN